MPWNQVSDELAVPPAGGAASLRRNRSITLADVDRNKSSSVHPAAAAPAPRVIDRGRMYDPFEHEDPETVEWPRAVVRSSPGLAAGEQVWGAKIWDAPGLPARDHAGKLLAFSGHDRDQVIKVAEQRVKELRWSKRGRLRLAGTPPEQEPMC
ncbi:hypothetical protein AA310_00650 [Arthrobacter sp. YC-RL1]|uniref:hypothetical protein n=1 Tax=Arthrobacter sp. YC-RL1 TaxID=1652545 RepID=UPI00063DD0D7|nr:hypothetical protein [Arthrobacter sp. YC-RL1]ALQ29094.1 hypothetical protein ATC04_00045 [Arthrobacter sp. YC-RL1]ALQ32182.1 hypothetical protein ATC04_17675 [Arthrobacter sp. YC-RL1]KLI90654.1 hypothetical protein AA310_00650 [Arthrobacter sp. YC-RL1]